MTKISFPTLLVCGLGLVAGASLWAGPRIATGDMADKAHASIPAARTAQELSAALARHHLTLVCPDAETHANLTYQRALMPDSFAASAADAVRSRTCRVRAADVHDFGQVMRD